MEELMTKGWRFELFENDLGSYTAIARKGKAEVSSDGFSWWQMVCNIVTAVDKYQKGEGRLFE